MTSRQAALNLQSDGQGETRASTQQFLLFRRSGGGAKQASIPLRPQLGQHCAGSGTAPSDGGEVLRGVVFGHPGYRGNRFDRYTAIENSRGPSEGMAWPSKAKSPRAVENPIRPGTVISRRTPFAVTFRRREAGPMTNSRAGAFFIRQNGILSPNCTTRAGRAPRTVPNAGVPSALPGTPKFV